MFGTIAPVASSVSIAGRSRPVNLWTIGCTDARLTAQARSPMGKVGKTLPFPPLPTGRRPPTNFTAPPQHQGSFVPGKVKPFSRRRGLSHFWNPVQTTGSHRSCLLAGTLLQLSPPKFVAGHLTDRYLASSAANDRGAGLRLTRSHAPG